MLVYTVGVLGGARWWPWLGAAGLFIQGLGLGCKTVLYCGGLGNGIRGSDEIGPPEGDVGLIGEIDAGE